jgi:outer membrane protein TolC
MAAWGGAGFCPQRAEATDEPLSLSDEETSSRVLPLSEFVALSVKKDSEFERILIDELALEYEKDLGLPVKDWVLEIKSQYDFILDQDREEQEQTVGLSKLFPFTGTTVEAGYSRGASLSSDSHASDFTLEVSQPIAQNAFGHATRLKDKILGLSVDVARHQIVEAYEDYLASIISGYYDWYEAYAKLQIGKSSYQQNLKLLDNIHERRKNNIALPIDVNKVHLQVLAKKERLLELQEAYAKALSFVKKAVRYDSAAVLMPQAEALYRDMTISFQEDFPRVRETSRTFRLLRLLEERSQLQVDREADDLLPSLDLFLGYQVKGDDYAIKEEDNMLYTGLSLEWPLGHQVDKAEYETARIALRKTQLEQEGTHFQLYKRIKDLAVQLDTEKKLLDIAEEKIALARSILEAEKENYSFGKVSLNDYIDAVNVFDSNRFNEITHDVLYKKYLIEWLRITDQLIKARDIDRNAIRKE